jgi:hypothetical protein
VVITELIDIGVVYHLKGIIMSTNKCVLYDIYFHNGAIWVSYNDYTSLKEAEDKYNEYLERYGKAKLIKKKYIVETEIIKEKL